MGPGADTPTHTHPYSNTPPPMQLHTCAHSGTHYVFHNMGAIRFLSTGSACSHPPSTCKTDLAKLSDSVNVPSEYVLRLKQWDG